MSFGQTNIIMLLLSQGQQTWPRHHLFIILCCGVINSISLELFVTRYFYHTSHSRRTCKFTSNLFFIFIVNNNSNTNINNFVSYVKKHWWLKTVQYLDHSLFINFYWSGVYVMSLICKVCSGYILLGKNLGMYSKQRIQYEV